MTASISKIHTQSYDLKEERINAISHGIGALLAAIAGLLLLIKGQHLNAGQFLGLAVVINLMLMSMSLLLCITHLFVAQFPPV